MILELCIAQLIPPTYPFHRKSSAWTSAQWMGGLSPKPQIPFEVLSIYDWWAKFAIWIRGTCTAKLTWGDGWVQFSGRIQSFAPGVVCSICGAGACLYTDALDIHIILRMGWSRWNANIIKCNCHQYVFVPGIWFVNSCELNRGRQKDQKKWKMRSHGRKERLLGYIWDGWQYKERNPTKCDIFIILTLSNLSRSVFAARVDAR